VGCVRVGVGCAVRAGDVDGGREAVDGVDGNGRADVLGGSLTARPEPGGVAELQPASNNNAAAPVAAARRFM
jgi:hypothetical protein